MKTVKNSMVVLCSVMFAVCVLAVAGIVAIRAEIGWPVENGSTTDTGTQSSSAVLSESSGNHEAFMSNPSAETPSSKPPSSLPESTPSDTQTVSRVGRYKKGSDVLEILSDTDGYIDAKLTSNGISMEFGGQPVEDVLTATETDSQNNTVRVTLIFVSGGISIQTEPIIRYEETAPYLDCTGVFRP